MAKPKKIPNEARAGQLLLVAQWEPLYCDEQGVWFHPGVPTWAFPTRKVKLWTSISALKGA